MLGIPLWRAGTTEQRQAASWEIKAGLQDYRFHVILTQPKPHGCSSNLPSWQKEDPSITVSFSTSNVRKAHRLIGSQPGQQWAHVVGEPLPQAAVCGTVPFLNGATTGVNESSHECKMYKKGLE